MTSDGDIEEDTIHCATCGAQVSLKKALVHMEKCFMKVSIFQHPYQYLNILILFYQLEGTVSFGGVVKNEW